MGVLDESACVPEWKTAGGMSDLSQRTRVGRGISARSGNAACTGAVEGFKISRLAAFCRIGD